MHSSIDVNIPTSSLYVLNIYFSINTLVKVHRFKKFFQEQKTNRTISYMQFFRDPWNVVFEKLHINECILTCQQHGILLISMSEGNEILL